MYVPTGADDVFAVSVETGKVLWRYEANLDQKISTVCCGWLNRGVALGDGKVYLGQLDGSLVALDQTTGKVGSGARRSAAGRRGTRSRPRRSTTTASSTRASPAASSRSAAGSRPTTRGPASRSGASTRSPAPARRATTRGRRTTTRGSTAARPSGRRRRSIPSSACSTSPPATPLRTSTAAERAGDNLFAASIVAVDVKTGEYRWHFQQVHHDIWDYDSPSPIVLFDAEIDGEERKGLGEASKTGWVYLLDRETGEPLLPIEERPVPQLGSQATAKTQPIPSYPPLFSHEVTDEDVAGIQKLADANTKDGQPKQKVVKGGIYTPFGETITAIVPGPQGGTNWQPSSYNPETGLMYVCAMRSVSGYSSKNEELPEGKRGQTADLGSVFTTTGFGSQEGYFVAIDVTTGEKVWEKRWPESCYSGSVTTGGNLVFVGRNGGQLEAYDAETGEGPLWSFQTGAGANTTATVFEQDGTQYLAFLAGGNALAATQHGDNLWLFSLEGTMDEVSAGAGTRARPRCFLRAGPRPTRAASGRRAPGRAAARGRRRGGSRPRGSGARTALPGAGRLARRRAACRRLQGGSTGQHRLPGLRASRSSSRSRRSPPPCGAGWPGGSRRGGGGRRPEAARAARARAGGRPPGRAASRACGGGRRAAWAAPRAPRCGAAPRARLRAFSRPSGPPMDGSQASRAGRSRRCGRGRRPDGRPPSPARAPRARSRRPRGQLRAPPPRARSSPSAAGPARAGARGRRPTRRPRPRARLRAEPSRRTTRSRS